MADVKLAAAVALGRFGLGPRPGDLDRVGDDARGAILAEIRSAPPRIEGPDILAAPAAGMLLHDENERIKREREAAAAGFTEVKPPAPAAADAKPALPPAPVPPGMAALPAMQPSAAPPPKPAGPPPVPQRLFNAEARARFTLAATAEIGFRERLVWFWSNHFAVSALKSGQTRATVGAFEREAIRPHVFGRFADMLAAAETHPTMLFYLDNQGSVGPNSPAGKNRNRGLNENLGREILELHTLGVGGGYSQEDVTALARILTGWTVVGPEGHLGRPFSAGFNFNNHEPGEQTLLGRTYPDWGAEQLRAALADIARHPATATHLATKLARHFVADVPPPALVARLAAAFRDTEGDLARVSTALVEAPEAWSAEREKMRSPQEFVMAGVRLTGAPTDNPGALSGPMNTLGHALWSPQGPNGFPDGAADWASAEGLKTRLDLAARTALRPVALDPAHLLDAAFGPAVSRETREAVLRAETRSQAVALLLMSPEFQRR